LEEMGHACK